MKTAAGIDSGIKKALLIYSAGAAAVFFIVMLLFTRFKMSAPLDDAFIYLQYAKNLSKGHFFEYVIGEGYSSGATSFLYAFLLAPFAFFLKGESLLVITYILGSVCLFFTGYYIYRLVMLLTGKTVYSWFGAAFFVTNGNFLWGFFSGMEICLFTMLMTAALYYQMREKDVKEQLLSLCLLSVVRPEGFLLVLMLLGIKLISKIMSGKAGKKDAVFMYFIPVLPGLAYFCINKILTGDFMPNTMRAKSDFSQYIFYLPEVLRNGFTKYLNFIMSVFNGSSEHWFMHYSLVIFLVGILPGMADEIKNRKPGIFSTAAAWFFIGILSTVFSNFFYVHNYRYPMPFAAIFVIFFTFGLYFLIEKMTFKSKETARNFQAAVLCLFLLFNVFTIKANLINFGKDCRDILDQSVSAGKWIKDNLPKDAVVAVNDVGAITYFSDAKIYDLVGLVTNRQAAVFRNGIGGVYEELEHKKPGYFMVHLGWFNYERFSFFGAGDKRLKDFHIKKEPAYFVVGSPEVCTEFKTELVNSGDGMKNSAIADSGYLITDKLDVLDLRSEKEHLYSVRDAEVPAVPGSLLEEGLSYGIKLIDGGRVTTGSEEFTVKGLRPGADVIIVRRSHEPARNIHRVTVDGKDAGLWESPAANGFIETSYVIKGRFVTAPQARINIREVNKSAYNSFYYWILQRGQ
jgi:hypothetical protein